MFFDVSASILYFFIIFLIKLTLFLQKNQNTKKIKKVNN